VLTPEQEEKLEAFVDFMVQADSKMKLPRDAEYWRGFALLLLHQDYAGASVYGAEYRKKEGVDGVSGVVLDDSCG